MTPDVKAAIECDPRIFALFCALNCCGYDAESAPEGFHPMRRALREQLAGCHQAAADFASYLDSAPALSLTPPRFPFWPRVGVMTEYVLTLRQPPALAPPRRADEDALAREWPGRASIRAEEIRPLMDWLRGLGPALGDFWREADIGALHSAWAPPIVEAAKMRVGDLSAAIQRCADYLGLTSLPFARLVVIPNPLQDSWTANFGRAQDAFFVVDGCPARIGSVWHELCHDAVAPILESHADLLAASEPLLVKVEEPMRAMGYWLADRRASWRRIVEESVVRAVCARLHGSDGAEDSFPFIPEAMAALREVRERRGQAFAGAVRVFLEHLAQLVGARSQP